MKLLFLLTNHVIDIHNGVVFCKLPMEIKCGKKAVMVSFSISCHEIFSSVPGSLATVAAKV